MRTSILASLSACLVAVAACSPPDPPTLTPQAATLVGADVSGLQIDVKLLAANPNKFALTAQKVVGQVSVNGKPLGNVTVPEAIVIPAGGSTTFDVTLISAWTDLAALGQAMTITAPMPFTIDGTVTFGGEKLNVDLPFHTSGTITPEQMKKTVSASVAPQIAPAIQSLQNLLQRGGSSPGNPVAPASPTTRPR